MREHAVACRMESALVLLFPQIWHKITSARGHWWRNRGASQEYVGGPRGRLELGVAVDCASVSELRSLEM